MCLIHCRTYLEQNGFISSESVLPPNTTGIIFLIYKSMYVYMKLGTTAECQTGSPKKLHLKFALRMLHLKFVLRMLPR